MGALVGSIEGSDVVGSNDGVIVGASLVGAMVGSTEGSDVVGSNDTVGVLVVGS